jgi:hypothetical protein
MQPKSLELGSYRHRGFLLPTHAYDATLHAPNQELLNAEWFIYRLQGISGIASNYDRNQSSRLSNLVILSQLANGPTFQHAGDPKFRNNDPSAL